jgi:hypothetical protein
MIRRHRLPSDLTVRDLVVLILAFAAGLSVVVLTVAGLVVAVRDPTNDVSTAYTSLVTGTLGVIIGALAGYVGRDRIAKGEDGAP